MNYNDAMDRINQLGKFGINLGLARIERLLENMGNPQNSLKFVHIVGTNGKGSVSTMLSNILAHGGHKCGLFTSPFVISFRETMQINGEMISENELAGCVEFVLSHWENSSVDGEFPTQFEVTTAIAFEWFKRRNCDIVCLEAGLGGGQDSTNIISTSCLQIVTSISLDHTAILGDSIAEIAHEKAGVIKGADTIIYPLMDQKAIEVIVKRCADVGSNLVSPTLNTLQIVDESWRAESFNYGGILYHKSLCGKFQVYNAITAIESAKQLRNQGFCVSDEDIKFGIANSFIPSRMEIISESPLVILDGSHNSGGAQALVEVLEELESAGIVMVMGVLADKEYDVILGSVCRYVRHFIAVEPDNPRALGHKELAENASKYCENVYSCGSTSQAVELAVQKSKNCGAIIVCGSLYLASGIRPILTENFAKQ